MKQIIILILIISSFSLSAETKIFPTITDAINYSGEKSNITKLVIIGDIWGDDYLPDSGSEWGMIRTLDEWFPSIEALELLTFQDMPPFADVVYEGQYGLFYAEVYDFEIFQYVNKSAKWLRSFSAPNIQSIGEMAFSFTENLREVHLPKLLETANHAFSFSGLETVEFPELRILTYNTFYCSKITNIKADKVTEIGSMCFYRCYFLLEADFPAVTTIWSGAFDLCSNMTYANFPKVTSIRGSAFYSCTSLTSLSIGTDFTELTVVEVSQGSVFTSVGGATSITQKVDLILGEYVLPKPNIEEKIWQSTLVGYPQYSVDYVWKSITIYTDIEEYVEEEFVYYLGNNIYGLEKNVEHIELYDITGRLLKNYHNETVIDVNCFNTGLYFLRYITNSNKIKIKKIIVN